MDAERRAGGLLRIVVADDDDDTRRLVARMFNELDEFDVVGTACDMATTRELVAARRPDVVVLDRMMPGFAGPEEVDGLRSAAPEAAIVVLSGYARDDPESAAVGAVVDGYVEKGAPKREVVRTVIEAARGERNGRRAELAAAPGPLTVNEAPSLSELANLLHDGPVAALSAALWTLDALDAATDDGRRADLAVELRATLRTSLDSTRQIVRLAREHEDDARPPR